MRRSLKRVAIVLVGMGILFGVTLACGSTESETPGSSDSAAPGAAAAPTAQDPVSAKEPVGKVESLLSGQTLARYQALPEEYRVALEAYAKFGVSDDLIPTVVAEKIEQWGDDPEPIRDLLDAERYAIFKEQTAIHPNPAIGDKARVHWHASYFLGYYPYVLLNEDTAEVRKQAFANLLDSMADQFELGKKPGVSRPPLDGLIIPTAAAALDALGPRLRDAIAVPQPNFTTDIDALAVNIVSTEVMLLKSEPGLEMPTLGEVLSSEDRSGLNGLPADVREDAERRYARGVVFRMISLAMSADHPTTSLPGNDVLAQVAQQEVEFAKNLAKQ